MFSNSCLAAENLPPPGARENQFSREKKYPNGKPPSGTFYVAKRSREKFNLRSVRLFQASRANVTFHFFAVFHVRNFLYVGFERSSGFTVGVAHVVSRSLTFSANVANLTHINTSAREFCKKLIL